MKLILEIVTAIILAEILEYPVKNIIRCIFRPLVHLYKKFAWKMIQLLLKYQARKYKKK